MQRIRAQLRQQQGTSSAGTSGNSPSVASPRVNQRPTSQPESVAQILDRIRARGGAQNSVMDRAGASGPVVTSNDSGSSSRRFTIQLHDIDQLQRETQTALEGSRQTGQLNPRNPGPVNGLIQFVKKVMRRSLTWYTRPLHLFEGAVIRALQQIGAILDNHRDILQRTAEQVNAHAEMIEGNRTRIASQEARLQQSESRLQAYEEKLQSTFAPQVARIADLQNEVGTLRGEIAALKGEVRQAQQSTRVRERDMRRLVHAIEQNRAGEPAPSSQPTPPMFPSEVKGEFEFDYFGFEDRYRGDEADIRQRQQEYLEYFRGRDNVVDIGCGRGEFLELLRDNNITARGIELGTDQYLLCKEKGLDVVQQDLFTFLESLADDSLGGIFSAQVIEHMTASDQLRYVALAHRKSKPGSPVIFETINAQCVYAVMRNFFLDPTHVRPIHPETLKFAMESMRFRNVELRFSGPVSDRQIPPLQINGGGVDLDHFNRAMEGVNELLYGYQDYAAIGWK